MIRQRQRHSKGAFTLLELLVSMGVIAVLAGLLLPAVAQSKRRAYSAVCIGNLRQLSVALQLYIGEQGTFPLGTSGDGLGSWQRALMMSGGSNVFYCPQIVRATDRFVQIAHPDSPFIYPHYGYNFLGAAHSGLPNPSLGLGGDFVLTGTTLNYFPAPAGRVVAPSQMIALGDSGAFLYTGVGARTNANPSDLLYILFPYVVPAFNQPGVGNWHDGSANMLFCDGHVESAKQSVWIKGTDQARRLWNIDNQPHPEFW